MENNATVLPTDAAARKEIPIATGVVDYFPAALAEIARVSKAGNDQHNPGQPLHWARGKSMDHADTAMRHFTERGTIDTDGQRHTAKAAWRILAMLQEEMEAAGAPMPRGARLATPVVNDEPPVWCGELRTSADGSHKQVVDVFRPGCQARVLCLDCNQSWAEGAQALPPCGTPNEPTEIYFGGILADDIKLNSIPGVPIRRLRRQQFGTIVGADIDTPIEREWNEGWKCPRCGTTELWIDETPYTVKSGEVVMCGTEQCLGYMVRE